MQPRMKSVDLDWELGLLGERAHCVRILPINPLKNVGTIIKLDIALYIRVSRDMFFNRVERIA
jgi:hypothetical protein